MADELISREALIAAIDDIFFKTNPDGEEQIGVLKCRGIARELPSVDAVEVVRCKDCKYYKQNKYDTEKNVLCQVWCDWLATEPDDFCSYGERKENATD